MRKHNKKFSDFEAFYLLKKPHFTPLQGKFYTLSLDIPSGLNSVTGKINGKSVNADETITFHKMKKGLINNSKLSGEVHLMQIGIPIEAESLF